MPATMRLPSHEVHLVGVCVRKKFRQKSAVREHLFCCVTMAEDKACPSRVPIRLRCRTRSSERCGVRRNPLHNARPLTMSTSGQSSLKRPAEVVDDILSVGCAMACANNRHDATLVEVGIATIEKYDWGIVAVAHSFWIIVACHRQWTNGMCVIKFLIQLLHDAGLRKHRSAH